jgi:PAS domain-containing protein
MGISMTKQKDRVGTIKRVVRKTEDKDLAKGNPAEAPLKIRAPLLDAKLKRARQEEALRLSNDRFELANRATFNAIWDWDLQTNVLTWNDTFQTLFGYAAEEIEPGIESWTNRIHP